VIPRILHQTWKDAPIPPRWQVLRETWRAHHPGWRHRLWTDADLRDLVATHYRWLLPTWEGYLHDISRVDAARYCLLHRHGGVYVDLDFECLRPVEPLLDGHAVVLGAEPASHLEIEIVRRREPPVTRLVCNAFMASEPGHPFWERVLRALPARAHDRSVLDVAGPFFLTDAVEAWGDRAGLHVAPAARLYPLDKHEVARGALDAADARLRLAREAFAVHHWAGTWIADFQAVTRRASAAAGGMAEAPRSSE